MVADEPSHLSLGAELGPGGVLTSYSAVSGPSALLFYGSVRASLDLSQTWAGSLVLRQWFLPANHATMLGVGFRWEPATGYSFGHWFVDFAAGLVSTRYAWAFGYDVGGGFEWELPDAPGVALGPYVRYGSVINPDRAFNDDGRAWTAGVSFSYHFGREGGPKTVRRTGTGVYHITIPDTDGDGVGDDQDQCRGVPQGKHPDPFKIGCPEGDEDGDDVPDVDDACPVTPPGDKPDPKRPGCPLVDSDNDGISDTDDACPTKAGVESPDRDKNGCPAGKRRQPVVEPDEGPPPESNPAPKTTKKRGKIK
jgi:hypothetical protein